MQAYVVLFVSQLTPVKPSYVAFMPFIKLLGSHSRHVSTWNESEMVANETCKQPDRRRSHTRWHSAERPANEQFLMLAVIICPIAIAYSIV